MFAGWVVRDVRRRDVDVCPLVVVAAEASRGGGHKDAARARALASHGSHLLLSF